MDVSFYLSVLEGDERETYTGESRPSKGAQVSLIYPALFMLSVTPFQMESSRNKQPQITNNTVCIWWFEKGLYSTNPNWPQIYGNSFISVSKSWDYRPKPP